MCARRVILAGLLLPGLAACGGFTKVTSRHKVRIETDPAGAWVSRIDHRGKQSIGQAPLETEVEVAESRYEASSGMWITSALLAAATGALTYGTFTTDESALVGVYGGLAISAGLSLLIALPVAITWQAQDGEVAYRGYEGSPPTFEATLAGYSSASAVLDPQAEPPAEPIALRLAPSGVLGALAKDEGAANVFGLGGLVGSSLEPPPPAKRPVMAVFALEDRSRHLSAESLDQLTDYVAARIAEAGQFRVVPRGELRARLAEKKAESYQACVDESCQIELGKALAAQKSLATRLIRAGGACAMTMTLYDLASEATESAATVRTECHERALMDGVDQLTNRLALQSP